jgi:cysteine desulfurase/selenocysteine lyase
MNREDFPLLARYPKLAYLDTANTALKPWAVIEAVANYYEQIGANVGRATYDLGEQSTAEYEAVRGKVATFVGAAPGEIIFTHSATYALNQVVWGLREFLRRGDVILLTRYEHNSSVLAWQAAAEATGAEVVYYDGGELPANVRVFSYCLASNITGEVFDYSELVAQLRAQGVLVVVDAAQAVGKIAVDVRELDCDFLVFSAHKMYGPSGVGVLYARRAAQSKLVPLVYGSQTFAEISEQGHKLLGGPARFEPGTPNIEGAIGLGAAVDYLRDVGLDEITAHDQALARYALEKLAQAGLDQFVVGAPNTPNRRIGVLSLSHPRVHPHDFAMLLNEDDVAVRAGKSCSDILMQELGLDRGVVRASFGVYSNESDVDRFVEGYARAIERLGRG